MKQNSNLLSEIVLYTPNQSLIEGSGSSDSDEEVQLTEKPRHKERILPSSVSQHWQWSKDVLEIMKTWTGLCWFKVICDLHSHYWFDNSKCFHNTKRANWIHQRSGQRAIDEDEQKLDLELNKWQAAAKVQMNLVHVWNKSENYSGFENIRNDMVNGMMYIK